MMSGSLDGHPLPIDQLKGSTPTEYIDFSYKNLGVSSAVIIASCIAGNEHLKQLKCARSLRYGDSARYRTCLLSYSDRITSGCTASTTIT